jgi:hypothetical protein
MDSALESRMVPVVAAAIVHGPILGITLEMKIRKSARVNDALIEIEDQEERDPDNRYTVVWRAKDEENRYSARSLEDAEEYYQYRCRLAEQRRI